MAKDSMSDKLKRLHRDVYQFYGDIKRKRIHTRDARNNVSGKFPKEYEKRAKKFFEPYTSINPVFHQFYTEKTGKFYENYLPDDFYYQKIDTYYNDWIAAITMGNKCLFPLIFSGGVQTSGDIFNANKQYVV